MVSPTPTTAQPPVLSYAESAKKAQGVKLPFQHTQKPLSNPPRQPPALPPEPKKLGKPSSSVEAAQISLADLSLSDASAPGAQRASVPSHTSTAESTTIHTPSTREAGTHGSPSAGPVPPLPPSQPLPVKGALVPNVWDQRIQQRNQARSQPRPPQSQPQTASSHVPRAASPPWDSSAASSAASSGSRQPDLLGTASVQSTQTPSSSSLNGASTSASGSSTGTTPSSRKELLLSPQRSSSVTDAESWPEVGKSHTSTGKSQPVGNGHAAVAEEKDVNALTSSHPGTPRKSEKTKWVAMPPGEFQTAATAAINPPRPYSQSRSHSQYSTRNSQTRSTAASVSGSTHDSQTPSKVPSSRTSASHSRAHSPNSIASSPQHPGRGRQFPVDVRGEQAPEQQQRSFEGNSPQAPVDVAAPVPYVQISRDVYGYGNLPTQTPSTQSFAPPPPPPHYPPALQVNPNHTQQPYVSSTVSPYPQPYTHHTPSDRYGPAPPQPLPPSWVPAEHYVYSYGYPPYAQAHPIMYWPGNLPLDLRQDGGAIYPSYAPVHPHQQVAPPGHVLQDDGGLSREGESTATVQPTLPPPTMISRPPPPQESDAVAGYRAMGSVLDTGTCLESAPCGRRDVVFGSLGAPGESKSPSPPLRVPSGVPPLHLDGPPESEKADRVVMTFSIGVAPGEAGPPPRSKLRYQPRLSGAENTADGKGPEPHTGTEVIDLTDSETKWEFGTANRSQDEFIQGDEISPELLEPQTRSLAQGEPPKPISLLFGGPLQGPPLPVVAAELPLAELQPPYPHARHPISYVQQQIHAPPRTPTQEELHAQTGPGYPVHQPPPPQSLSSPSTDGFEVKDFGYGFGRAGGTGHGMASTREERLPREREWERSRETDREQFPWRPRRGSYSGHNERGGYAGRRARGANGFGRGPGRGFGRGFRPPHFHQHQHQHQQQQQQQPQQHQKQQQQQQQQPQPQASPFTVTPPAQAFQPLQPSTPPQRALPDVGQYLGTAVQQPPYMPHTFEAYQAPVPLSYPTPNANVSSPTSAHPLPRPLSNLTFPLDPTRFYLLGQLEYYLSAQNLISDIFLRKRMDSRGWIPISLLASFNRVRQLTLDPQLVREVLALSHILEMRDDCVRMGGGEWAQFVLPDAPMSTVEISSGEMGNGEDGRGGSAGGEGGDHVDEEGEVEEEEEEEDEEDIEIVMDGQRWMGPLSS